MKTQHLLRSISPQSDQDKINIESNTHLQRLMCDHVQLVWIRYDHTYQPP